MQILLINQFFWPDLAATSQFLTDLVRHLSAEGHSVTVVAARSSYAGRDSTEAPPGVRVLRAPDMPFGRTRMSRVLSYASFLLFAFFLALRAARPDLVITMTTPPLVSMIGTLIHKLRGARHWIWEMDMYPDVAIDLQVLKPGSLAARVSGAIADWNRKNACGILALAECMRDRLLARGVPASKIFIADNWADGSRIHPMPPAQHGGIRVVYAGNLGMGHDLETTAAAIEALADDPRVSFTLVGGGSKYVQLQERCAQRRHANVNFLGYCTPDELSLLLSASDVALVSQIDACVGSIVPSKMYSMMAAGLPVLFIGPEHANPARIIQRFSCGWRVSCGASDALVSLLQTLAAHPDLAHQAAHRARQAFLANYDKPIGVARICNILGVPQHTAPAVEVSAIGV